MSWPQLVVLLLSAWSLVFHVVAAVRDRSTSTGWATFAVFLHVAFAAGYVLVLHAGGFW